MLPFTKRPGRSDDGEVVAKDDASKSSVSVPSSRASVPSSPASVPPSSAKASLSTPAPSSARPPQRSMGEDEMTSIMQSRSVTGPLLNAVLPAAGRPASVPPPAAPSRPPSVRPSFQSGRPPPSSGRNANQMDEDAEDEDGGRTVVRGAPKIVKRTSQRTVQPAASISPAAVIKATLESARANRRENLLPGPPADLLEDRSDFGEKATPQRSPFSVRAQQHPTFEGPPTHRPVVENPPSYPPTSHYAHGRAAHSSVPPARVASEGRAYPQAAYSARHPSAASVPGVSMPASPAHFMRPQAPYSDPPGTAVTSGHRIAGRPAVSWAAALLACGLFVGVAAVAMIRSGDTIADTTASFVDPSRAPTKANASQLPPNAGQPAQFPAPVMANGAPLPDPNGAPVGFTGANPVPSVQAQAPMRAEQPAVVAAPVVAAPVVAAPVVATPGTVVAGFAPVTVPSSTPPKRPAVTWRPAPPAAAAPAPKPTPAPKAAVASTEEEPAPKKDVKATTKSTASKKAAAETPDDETKKALEALQKAQLESASSFGKE